MTIGFCCCGSTSLPCAACSSIPSTLTLSVTHLAGAGLVCFNYFLGDTTLTYAYDTSIDARSHPNRWRGPCYAIDNLCRISYGPSFPGSMMITVSCDQISGNPVTPPYIFLQFYGPNNNCTTGQGNWGGILGTIAGVFNMPISSCDPFYASGTYNHPSGNSYLFELSG